MGKFKQTIKGLFRGLKGADEVITQNASHGSEGIEINQQMVIDNVMSDFLRGEETQRVKETRDEYYRVLDESNNYKVLVNGFENERNVRPEDIEHTQEFGECESDSSDLTISIRKKTPLDFVCKIPVYNPENLPLKVIQENKLVQSENNISPDFSKAEDFVGTFNIERESGFTPRFKIEDYLNKIVVRQIDEKTSCLDIYVSMYASQFGFTYNFLTKKFKKDNSSLLVSELNRLYKKEANSSDVTDIKEIIFTTDKAYGVKNPSHFEFDEIKFKEINTFDGNFVLTFIGNNKVYDYSAIEKYHTDEIDKKNEERAPREGKDVDINVIIRNIEKKDNENCN